MFRNYFTIAWRNLKKHKVFSFINIMGLAVGITACFLIFLYVQFELSYDTFHTKADRIYRVVADLKTPSDTFHTGTGSAAFGPNIKADFPEVEAFVRFERASILVKKGTVKFQEANTIWADSTFFTTFSFPLVYGDAATALKEPLSVVFTETTAKKYFGDVNPVGQTVQLTGELRPATVTGVVKDLPENTLIKADMFLSMSTRSITFHENNDAQWISFSPVNFLLLKPGTDAEALEKKFPAFINRRLGEALQEHKMALTLTLEKLKNLYLHSTYDGLDAGSLNNVYIFSVIAVFILLIACINFVNLTTARATERAREVGIRKVAGAQRLQLAAQFVGESLMLCLAAFIVAMVLSALLIPFFNQLAGKTISKGFWYHLPQAGYVLLAGIVLGILAGLYPAIVLARFQPVTVLKGRFATGTTGAALRKGLVMAQFTISIALIIATITVYRQMNYMRSQNLGFNKDQMLIVETNGDDKREAFKNALTGIPGVQAAALSSSVPGRDNSLAYSLMENAQGEMQTASLDAYFVDWDYLQLYGLKLLAGRDFSRSFGTDTTQAMIVNEAMVKRMGYSSPQQIIGKRFSQWGREGNIIGVVNNFNFRSLQTDIRPLTIRIESDNCDLVTVKIAAGHTAEVIKALEARWNKIIPHRPFGYFFLDEYFDKQYRGHQRFGQLFFNFAMLAIIISCLGLLGLASYSTLQRTREIGVRKVLGASVFSIVNLLSFDFLKLVLVAFVIATPVAGFFMHRWLSDFAYRSNLSWWVFAGAGGIALAVTLFTISFQAIRAALANPVRSLKTE